jgi:phosphopantothenoylcysteine decarboxylase/phosphopantothenate--cysteine ligase
MRAPARILLCITGGIAAYKVVEVARSLRELGHDVTVVMTPSAERFVGRQTFASITGRPVLSEMFTASGEVPHVELARATDLVLIAPATAHALSRLATGAADDLLCATLLMVRCPVLAVPAMHTEMWEHPATQANRALLAERGTRFVGPASGALLSGDSGAGRMVEPAEIVTAALELLEAPEQLAGARVLVTAGGAQEPIDPVRFIGNRSSGLMGFALASEAARRGAKVTLVVGDTSLQPPSGVDVVHVHTAEDMRAAVLEAAVDSDAVIKAAAVADFRPVRAAAKKLKKAAGAPAVELVPTPDILKELGESPELRKPGSLLVGFAAETESDPEELGRLAAAKRSAKSADVIVANDVSSSDSGFGTRTNRAVIAGPEGIVDAGLVTKTALAEAVIDEVVRLLKGREDG